MLNIDLFYTLHPICPPARLKLEISSQNHNEIDTLRQKICEVLSQPLDPKAEEK